MQLHLNILPPAQLKLWPLLKDIPSEFILYGGTAIALQLGHRVSIDFDFFSDLPLNRDQLIARFPLLKQCNLVQPELNTIDCIVDFPEGFIKLQFLAGFADRQKRVSTPLIAKDNQLQIASLKDLFATKLNTIQHRAECKDYIDIDAMIQSGLSLEEGLGCAVAVYGKSFDSATSLRALCSYRDGNLSELKEEIKERLSSQAVAVKKIPDIKPLI
ncbi:MAG TPA: nucleotidyl transferase AbiEii/AbiGii toxin family protein [Gammaproteobacteria bacterium]|nr:nucleotidyl transferase AbiEii/AbiGii toxin family protein [Gammaproteobacteria bacterium]